MPENPINKLMISVFIISKNEGDRITHTINSVKDWVDEIIVVDSGSTDNTIEIAENLGAKVIKNDWPGYGPQKRFAEEQCRNKWVLNLDADEAVSDELALEIKQLFTIAPDQNKAFKLKIQELYPHQEKLGRFPYTYKVVRLYHLDHARYSDSPIHDRVILSQQVKVKTLKGSVVHRSIRSLDEMIKKNLTYVALQVETFLSNGRTISPVRLIFEFPLSFLSSYIFRGNILRGSYGLILSYHHAYIRFIRIAMILEKQKLKLR